MSIEILFITCNRLEYTKKAMASLLADPDEQFLVSIWDNVSTDGTREYLESVQDPRIKQKVFARKNAYLTGAANEVFGKSKADLLAIIPDDFLLPPGWTRPLAAVHEEVPRAGLISAWFLGKEFFDERRASHKIQNFGKHRVLRHPWTGGGAALFKREAWEESGRFEGVATPECWKRMAAKGYINGFIVPPIFVEHMDDPWSRYYSGVPGEIRKMNGRITDEQMWEFHLAIVREILDGPWDVKSYLGWRGKLRTRKNRIRRKLSKLGFGEKPPDFRALRAARVAAAI
jgi:hypothetical protein